LTQQFTGEGRRRIGPPLAWAIAATAVATVFALVVMIVNYAPRNSAGQEQIVRRELPAARYDVVAALIKAAGRTCPKVCAIAPGGSFSGASTLTIACSTQVRPSDCTTLGHYTIAVSPSD